MGMDVFGKNPKNEQGKYFRNNVWYWHPLWDYCASVNPALCDQVLYAHSNDGDGLEEEQSLVLAADLRRELASGATLKYSIEREEKLKALPQEECVTCEGTGMRDPETVCMACDGTGYRDSFDTWYAFRTDNVAEFATFLENCGGFEIC